MSTMTFWEVKAYDTRTLRNIAVYVDANHDKEKLEEILREVHPEWDKLIIKTAIRPKGMRPPLLGEAGSR